MYADLYGDPVSTDPVEDTPAAESVDTTSPALTPVSRERELARPNSPNSDKRAGQAEAAVGTSNEAFYEWLAYEFKGDVSQLDHFIVGQAQRDDRIDLVNEGYLKLSDGDKMDLFQKLGQLKIVGAGAEINKELSEKSLWERFTSAQGHIDWAKFATAVRTIDGNRAVSEVAAVNNAVEAKDFQSMTSNATTVAGMVDDAKAAIENLSKIKSNAIGEEGEPIKARAAKVLRDFKVFVSLLVSGEATALLQAGGLTLLQVEPISATIKGIIDTVAIGLEVSAYNDAITELEKFKTTASAVDHAIIESAIAGKRLDRNVKAAGALKVAAAVGGSIAVALGATGVGLGLILGGLAISGIIALVSWWSNKKLKEANARKLLASIHGLAEDGITDENENEYLMKVGYAPGQLGLLYHEYLDAVSRRLYESYNANDSYTIELLQRISGKNPLPDDLNLETIKGYINS
jgi:hypothetical protein